MSTQYLNRQERGQRTRQQGGRDSRKFTPSAPVEPKLVGLATLEPGSASMELATALTELFQLGELLKESRRTSNIHIPSFRPTNLVESVSGQATIETVNRQIQQTKQMLDLYDKALGEVKL